ncbi:uncharacterized protein PGTG_17538 [Puccinia graminis f. sp. tritici CRL 75-36-700-3]|uniref:Uncharacterized protein n=1 Tax=Puccinia graminis f. sp. tritici (strain CRL 75-36-700-3 / race SCCL) TaxID=418459 RepID=E3L557_PUCGT|nr:uncharacterized protein PGTG_17538 [Puccinia graminis f. sp. tritici CRL 75-36-700-3]EFP91682.2 hypothetical protein PGTG_17538 [Puccinia graminis f. sp. tritici CRL 75-36-700-3]
MKAMETEHKRIEYLIESVKKRDEILGDSLGEFYDHLKMLTRARLYDLCTDSPLTLWARHPGATQASSPTLTEPSSYEGTGTPSARHLIEPLFNILGHDFRMDHNGARRSKIPRLRETVDSVASQDEALTRSSRTLGTFTCKNDNQEGILKRKNEDREVNLHGEPLRMIQYMVSPLDGLWVRLESFVLWGLTNSHVEDPLFEKWYAARHSQLWYETLGLAITREDIKSLDLSKKNWVMRNYVEAVFRLAEYIRNYDLLPPNFTSKVKIFEPSNLVLAIKCYATEPSPFGNQLMEILMWKPRGFVPGPEFLRTHEFFEPFHRPMREKLASDTNAAEKLPDCQRFMRIREGFCEEEEFLKIADNLHSMLRSPSAMAGIGKSEEIRNHKIVSTIQEIFKCFDEPASMQGEFHEHQFLNIYYMVHFLNTYYKPLVDESIKTIGINILILEEKIKYMIKVPPYTL